MGTVNYETSKYITLGLQPLSAYDLERDEVFMQVMQEQVDEYGGSIEDAISEYIEDCTEEDWYTAEKSLSKYFFRFFDVRILPGYYEGFSIQIDTTYNYYDDWNEKREAMKEATQLKNFLLECVENGLVQCFPGWCTAYASPEKSRHAILEAVAEIKREIKAEKTFRQYWANVL